MVLIRAIWFLCLSAIVWFALAPSEMGGLGGAGYHGVAFMILGLLTPPAFPRVPMIAIWAVLLAFGGGIELAQDIMGFKRYGEWGDFAIDAIAATVGIIYYRLWLYLRAVMARSDASDKTASDPATKDGGFQDF